MRPGSARARHPEGARRARAPAGRARVGARSTPALGPGRAAAVGSAVARDPGGLGAALSRPAAQEAP
jgi:hypothetical protein